MDELEWSYKGGTGPAHWGALSSYFSECSNGGLQSPIDIKNTQPSSIKPINFYYYKSLRIALKNTGYTVELDFADGNDIMLGKTIYKLKQVHFHTPSEHTVDGQQYPIEIHFVHVSKSHRVAVIALFVEEGEENNKFKQIIRYFPKNKNDSDMFYHKNLNPAFLLPENRSYYKYTGSLTTPPCSEGVTWFVLKNSINLSNDQINTIRNSVGTNNRPIQPTNNRNIRETNKEIPKPVEPVAVETPTEETPETKEATETEGTTETEEAPVSEEAPEEAPIEEEVEESEVEEIETEIEEEAIIEDIELEESSEVIVD